MGNPAKNVRPCVASRIQRTDDVYFEPAAIIAALVLLGQVLGVVCSHPKQRCDSRAAWPGSEDSKAA